MERNRKGHWETGQLGNWAAKQGKLGNQPQPPEPNFLISLCNFRHFRHFRHFASGLTLIEVLVVLGVLLGALYATLFVYTQGFGVLEANGQRLQAGQWLQAELERLRVTPYDALPPEAHRLPAADTTRLAPVTLGHAPFQARSLIIRRPDGSPAPAPAAVDAATGRLLLPTAPRPQTVLITYTYAPPPPPEGGEGWVAILTGTYLDEGLQPVPQQTPRKRLTVLVAWMARGKEHRIEGHLLRTP